MSWIRRNAILLGLVLALPCSAGATELPDLPGVRSVIIETAGDVDRAEVLRLVGLGAGSRYDDAKLDEIRQRLEETQLFSQIEIEPRRVNDEVDLIVRLERQAIVASVRFEGNHSIGTADLARASRLQDWVAFNRSYYESALERVRSVYRQEGFEHASITMEVRQRHVGELDLIVRVNEGEPLRVAEVQLEGAPAGLDEELRKTIGVVAGDRFRRKDLRLAERNVKAALRRAGFYEGRAESSWQASDDTRGTFRVVVQPGPRFALSFEGNTKFKDKELLQLIDIEKRVVVTDGTWRELKRRIEGRYHEAGYYMVSVRLELGAEENLKRVTYTIEEGSRFQVAPVEFEGRHGVEESVLRDSMRTGPSTWIPWRRGTFLQEEFDEDLKRLWFLYRTYGFLDAQITNYRIVPDPNTHEIHVVVVLEEGTQTIVRSIDLRGFESLSGALPPLRQHPGQPLDQAGVDMDRERLEKALRDAGYLNASVHSDVVLSPEESLADVRFGAEAGEQVRVGQIVVRDNYDTRARVIRRELPFRTGDILRAEDLVVAQTNLYRLGLFRGVTLEPLAEEPGESHRDVVVRVAERPPISVQFGAGYNTRDGFRGFSELSHNNLGGRARRLSLRADMALDPGEKIGPNEYLGDLGWREPRIAGSLWNLRANIVVQRATRSIDQFSIERTAVMPAIDRVILPGLQAGFELQLEKARIFSVKPDVLAFNPRDEGWLDTTSFGPYLIYEGRDDPFAPTRGVFDSIRVRYAPAALDSDVPWVKIQAHHSQYLPVSSRLTFVYAVRAGWVKPMEPGTVVPLRERFFLGGRSTVRGFPENEVGPRGAPIFDQFGQVVYSQRNPLGGDLALNLNAELRFPLALGAQGVIFSDGGGVYLQDNRISAHEFRKTAGLGLLYTTPVGPIALHYGFKLDRRHDESPGAVHFSIGTMF